MQLLIVREGLSWAIVAATDRKCECDFLLTGMFSYFEVCVDTPSLL